MDSYEGVMAIDPVNVPVVNDDTAQNASSQTHSPIPFSVDFRSASRSTMDANLSALRLELDAERVIDEFMQAFEDNDDMSSP